MTMHKALQISWTCFWLTAAGCPRSTGAQTIDWQGEIAGWTYVTTQPERSQVGIRYLPTLFLQQPLTHQTSCSVELSAHAYGYRQISGPWKDSADGRIKPYRLWLRFTTTRLELRAGLQKINWGSALLLRPLMWFDRIDPRDPLQLTDGVYALLLRYYTQDNRNLWLWTLYGNKDPRGWDYFATASGRPEYGGRLEWPVPAGEIAFSSHFRTIHPAGNFFWPPHPHASATAAEQRLGIDGKWDLGIGCWFEGAVIHQDSYLLDLRYRSLLTLGADYTLGIGNGCHVLMEHLFSQAGSEFLDGSPLRSLSVVSFDYPLNILDQVSYLSFFNWQKGQFYHFLSWKRTLDNLQFFIMGFYYPDSFDVYPGQQTGGLFSDTGVQVMIVFNY